MLKLPRRRWPLRWAWARWALFSINVALSLAATALVVLVGLMAIGDHADLVALLFLIPLSFPALFLGWLARAQFYRRGHVGQTGLSILVLIAALASTSGLLALYGIFSLLSVWVLGDFEAPPRQRSLAPRGTPAQLARRMWNEGRTSDEIRTALAARRMPAADVETLIYALVTSAHSEPRLLRL